MCAHGVFAIYNSQVTREAEGGCGWYNFVTGLCVGGGGGLEGLGVGLSRAIEYINIIKIIIIFLIPIS